MKKIINNPSNFVEESIDGLIKSHPDVYAMAKDNNRVFLFNGWTFASSPTLQSIDHPVYDLWITGCENI